MHTLLKILILLFAYLLIGNAQAQSCSFKTQIKYLDGTIGCIEDLPIANQTADGDNLKLIDSINRSLNYAVARSKTPDCKSLSFSKGSSATFNNSLRSSSTIAIDMCMNAGCDCEIIIVNGNALVDKESLISGRSLTASTPELIKQVAVDEKQIQQELAKKQQLEKEQKALAEKTRLEAEKRLAEDKRLQQELAKKEQLEKEQKIAEEKRIQLALVKQQELEKEQKALAEKTRLEAEKRLAEDKRLQQELAKKEQLEKEQKIAEEKRIQLALVKQQELEKEQKVLAEKARLEQDLLKKAQLEIEQKALAEKARIEADRRLVDEKRLQQELAKKEQLEKEQKITEEKRIQLALVKQQELEKEQKALAEKARLEADKQLAEAKRIQQEQAKQAQSDKELAEKTRIAKEKQLAEEKSSQTQLVRLQALEKENADLIARLQQEKVTASKALSDEARILALRKELEKEIRASIQNESSGAQGASKPKQAPQIFANRKALVIGNDAYKKVTPLFNAAEDAKVVAESLTALGFKVSLKLDVDRKQFQSEIRAFKNQVKAGDEVAIFYAGHGVQIASTNYLLPIDIAGQNEEEIRDDAISLQRILDDMTEKEAKFTLAMIDACRDNPFKSSGRSVIGTRGLAPTTAATGQMIVFSAGTGQQALDKLGPNDKSKNGLFTRVFVKEMQKAGVSVDRVVRNVRTEVVALAKSVGHNQVPAIYDQVVGEFYFKQ